MKYKIMGKSDISVSHISFGTGTKGSAGGSNQSNITKEKFRRIMETGYQKGVTFWDTSNAYGTQRLIAYGKVNIPREKLVISTKSHASSAKEMGATVEQSLNELETSYIDIFMLHEVDTQNDFKNRLSGVLELLDLKKRGIIKAIGVSTHSIDILEQIVKVPFIDVICTNFNLKEVHMDAGISHYQNALQVACKEGKGVYVMKTLGEGALSYCKKDAIFFNLGFKIFHSVCIGIQNLKEVEEAIEIYDEWALGSG